MKKQQKGFSLVEVLFAVVFLLMVGLAMTALNSAATRLTQATEVRLMGSTLNTQAIQLIALLKKVEGTAPAFRAHFPGDSFNGTKPWYVVCPVESTQIGNACTISANPQSVLLGSSRLNFTSEVRIHDLGSNKFLVNGVTKWGGGVSRQIKASKIVE